MNKLPLYYISDEAIIKYLKKAGVDFLMNSAEKALYMHYSQKIQQPVKQYLTMDNNPFKRIISMPILSSDNDFMHGLKWIASNPENVYAGIERANSIIILNDNETLAPHVLMSGNAISSYRTLANSILVIKRLNPKVKSIGVIGLGKLGKLHIQYLPKVFSSIESINCFSQHASLDKDDLNKLVIEKQNIKEIFANSEVIITTTTPHKPYIDTKDIECGESKILVNVSLADYTKEVYQICDTIIVDDVIQCAKSEKVFKSAWENNVEVQNNTIEFSKLLFDRELSQKKVDGLL